MWMAFYFPQLSLEALGINDESPPTGLINQHKSKLTLCSKQALQAGLNTGMSLSLAYTFCSDLQLREPNKHAEQEHLEALALCLNQFSGTVSISPPRSILIEVASMLRYFGSVEAIADQASEALQLFSNHYDVGFAKTGKLALWRALARKPLLPTPNWSDLQTEQWIEHIPIHVLDWPSDHVTRLQGMGFNALESLYRLPTSLLRRHLGLNLYTQFGHALGFIKESHAPYQIPESFSRERTFEYEIESSLGLLFPLRPIIQAMCLFLQRRRQLMYAFEISMSLAWTLDQTEEPPVLRVQHDLGSDNPKLWMELTELKLNRLIITAPIRSIRVEIVKMEQSEEESGDLFDDQKQITKDQNLFISRLKARLGEQAILTPTLSNDHLPEQAMRFQSVPVSTQTSNCKAKESIRTKEKDKLMEGMIPPTKNDHAHRPAWQTKKPEKVSTKQFQILSGPERITSSWWLEKIETYTTRRDYYIARWYDGRKAWVFRDDLGGWYLHGWFG